MKKLLGITKMLFVILVAFSLVENSGAQEKSLIKAQLVSLSHSGLGSFYGIVPLDKNEWPLLTADPQNSFAFVIFYSMDDLKLIAPSSIEKNAIVLKTPNYKSGRSTVNLSKLRGFNKTFNELKSLSRYDLVDKQNEIIYNIRKTHIAYNNEYKKYLKSVFTVSDTNQFDFEYYYDLNNQSLRLSIIGEKLYNTLYKTSTSADWYGHNPFLIADPNWRSKSIKVKLPAKLAKKFMEGSQGKKQYLLYKYVFEPKPGIRKGTCGFKGICNWMPFLEIRQIEILLIGKKGSIIASYIFDNINEKTVNCTPSFSDKTIVKLK